MEKSTKINLLWAVPIALASVFFRGILVNSQSLAGVLKFSGGLPFTYLELYLPDDMKWSVASVVYCFTNSRYKVDLAVLPIDMLLIYLLVKFIRKKFGQRKETPQG